MGEDEYARRGAGRAAERRRPRPTRGCARGRRRARRVRPRCSERQRGRAAASARPDRRRRPRGTPPRGSRVRRRSRDPRRRRARDDRGRRLGRRTSRRSRRGRSGRGSGDPDGTPSLGERIERPPGPGGVAGPEQSLGRLEQAVEVAVFHASRIGTAARALEVESGHAPVDSRVMSRDPFPAVPLRPDLGDFAWAARLRDERRERGAPTIGAIIHTRNEERNVADAVRSVSWADHVLVVDMESEDRTVEIAEALGAEVASHPNTRHRRARPQLGDRAPADRLDPRGRRRRARPRDARAHPRRRVGARRGRRRRDRLRALDLRPARAQQRLGQPLAQPLLPRRPRPLERPHPLHARGHRARPARPGRRGHLPRALQLRRPAPLRREAQPLHRQGGRRARGASRPPTGRGSRASCAASSAGTTRPTRTGRSRARWRSRCSTTASSRTRSAGSGSASRTSTCPSDPRVALRDLAHDGRILHAAGIEAFEAGDAPGATDLVRRSVAEQVDVDHLNDLAVLMAQTGRSDEARSLLQTCLDPRPRPRGRAREPRRPPRRRARREAAAA